MRIGRDTFAVVVGGAGGIGSAVASVLSSRGASLALIDIDRAGLSIISAALPRCVVHECDAADAQAMNRLARRLATLGTGIDVLVNCAGLSVSGEIEALPLDQFERCMATNFWSVVHSCRAFLPQIRAAAQRRREAAICNLLSDFALISLPTKAAYSASKHAARAFTEALGAELHGSRIAVIAAYPGATATGFVRRGYATKIEKQKLEASFLERGVKPSLVASRIVRAIEKNKSRVLIGADAHLIDAVSRISPTLVHLATRRFWRRVPFL